MRKVLALLPFVALLWAAKGYGQAQSPAPGYWKLVEKQIVDSNLKPVEISKNGDIPLKSQDGGEADFRVDENGLFYFNDGLTRACKIENGKMLVFAQPDARHPENTLDVLEHNDDKLVLTLDINGTKHLYVYHRQKP